MSKWIRQDDEVVVIAGNEKGSKGKVLHRSKNRVVIQGLNIRKKHVKPRQKMQPGIVDMETPVHISNVSHCNSDGKPVKIKVKQESDGTRNLVYTDGGKEVVLRTVKQKKK